MPGSWKNSAVSGIFFYTTNKVLLSSRSDIQNIGQGKTTEEVVPCSRVLFEQNDSLDREVQGCFVGVWKVLHGYCE